MELSKYLDQDEIVQLNKTFEASLHHDHALVFWTGISPSLAKDWAIKNNLKTLTMAMGSLYSDNGQKSQRSGPSWSRYMKGASWIFAQHACHNRYAIVLTNKPPNVYSTREHSTYCEIEEPILKGLEVDQHTMRIDHVHPAVPGAENFRYQIWPDNRSYDWFAFLESISVKNIANKILQCVDLHPSKEVPHKTEKSSSWTAPRHVSVDSDSAAMSAQDGQRQNKREETTRGKREQQMAQEKKLTNRQKKEREQQREQQMAQAKKLANRQKKEREQHREQQMAQAKKLATRQKKEWEQQREQQMAQAKKLANRQKKEWEQQREQQMAQEKKLAKRLKANAKL